MVGLRQRWLPSSQRVNWAFSRMQQKDSDTLSARHPAMSRISMKTLPVDTTCESKGRIVFMAMNISGNVTSLIQPKRMDPKCGKLARRLSKSKMFGYFFLVVCNEVEKIEIQLQRRNVKDVCRRDFNH